MKTEQEILKAIREMNNNIDDMIKNGCKKEDVKPEQDKRSALVWVMTND